MSFLWGSPRKDPEREALASRAEAAVRELTAASTTVGELAEQLSVLEKGRAAAVKDAVEKVGHVHLMGKRRAFVQRLEVLKGDALIRSCCPRGLCQER